MARLTKFRIIADKIVSHIATQIMKLLHRGSDVDLYFNLKKLIIDAQEAAYDEGLREGRNEILRKIKEFDDSKDEVGN